MDFLAEELMVKIELVRTKEGAGGTSLVPRRKASKGAAL